MMMYFVQQPSKYADIIEKVHGISFHTIHLCVYLIT
jgi:hypothetical protein